MSSLVTPSALAAIALPAKQLIGSAFAMKLYPFCLDVSICHHVTDAIHLHEPYAPCLQEIGGNTDKRLPKMVNSYVIYSPTVFISADLLGALISKGTHLLTNRNPQSRNVFLELLF
jgi:hypothetical protein